MAKINILSPEICNRIAAGEVIERPCSAVKELVDNSLDAGATEIEVSIQRGGKDMIRVTDNGCGIEKDDMRAAFFAHATSKIKDIEDIDSITTLGFRGEALATIASIAKVELISVTQGNEANRVYCDGDFIGKVEPAVWEKGTQITVTDFFFNTPVRAKFLKADKKEEVEITNFITRYILGNPNVAFKYFVDGKLTMQSYGGGLEEAIAQVYGSNFLPNCYKIKADRNDIQIHGFISNQNFFKPNKTYQNLYLNGRYIVNQIISGAIINAYSAYTMKRQFPVYMLFVDVPLDFVDVNVHPNKSDVRFVNNTVMYGTIYKVISAVLDGTAKATDFIVGDSAVPKICEPYADMPKNQSGEAIEYNQTGKIYDKNFNDIQSMPNFEQEKGKEKPKNKLAIDDKFDYTPYENYVPPITNPRKNQIDAYYGEMMNVPTKVCGNSVTDVRTPLQVELDNLSVTMQQQHIDYDCCKFQGKLFNTYLLYELRDEIYMIDQHAAHERLLFDEFMQKVKDRKIAKQGMVVSFILDLNATESQFISSNLQVLRSMGFDIEPFGMNAYRIKAIPADLQDINLQQFFADLLSDINSLKEITLENVLKEKIATMACKHAVKGGMDLTEQEREKLFEMVKDNLGLKCPHGRPICVKLTKTQIERMFKRIV